MRFSFKFDIITYILGLYMFLLPWDRFFSLETTFNLPFSPTIEIIKILLGLFILFVIIKRIDTIVIPRFLIPLLLLLVYASVSLFWYESKSEGFDVIKSLWIYFLIIFLFLHMTSYLKVNIKKVLWFYILGTLSLGIYFWLEGGLSVRRFVSLEGYNPTWYSAFIVWALVSSAKLYLDSKILGRIILITIDLTLVAFLLLTQGRNSILAISLSMFLVLLMYMFSVKRKNQILSLKLMNPLRIFSIMLFFIIGVSMLFFIQTNNTDVQLEKLADIKELFGGDSSQATAGRTDIWKNYLKDIDIKNIYGTGVHSSTMNYVNIYRVNKKSQPPHNTYILTLVEFGIIGLLLWLSFLWLLIKYSLLHEHSRYILFWLSLIFVFMAIGNDILTYKYWWDGLTIYILITRFENKPGKTLSIP